MATPSQQYPRQPEATAVRPSWEQIADQLREGLADLLGGIISAHMQGGGFTPGLAVRLQLADGGQAFAKGIPTDHVLAEKYRAEADTARWLSPATPAPQLRWSGTVAGWVVLVFDDVDGRCADLAPGSPDIPRVVATIAGLADLLTPCPAPAAPPATTELAELVHGWRELATDPPSDLDDWTRRHLPTLAELETRWLEAVDGKTLLHGDIQPSNLLIRDADDAVFLVDWAQPACGAAWIDVADLIPHLILAGHIPAAAEQALTRVPTWHDTPPDVITSYAAAFAGYWARMSRRPAPPGVPHLRAHQARAGGAALAWTAHRIGWP